MKINRSNWTSLFVILIIFLLLIPVSPNTLGKEPTVSQDSDEIKIISNTKIPSPNDGIKIRIVFEEELSIGVEEGDENYMFGGRVYFNADDEGNIYINDWDRKRIQKRYRAL